MFGPGRASRKNLIGLHPLGRKVVMYAYSIVECDMSIIETLRTMEQQENNVAIGASQTMDSSHLLQKDGFAWAVDIYPWVNGRTNFDEKYQLMICKAMQLAANKYEVKMVMGCFWVSFKETINGVTRYGDRPHFQFDFSESG